MIELNTTHRSSHGSGGKSQCFESYVPSGTLKLDVAVPGGAAPEPRLVFLGRADAPAAHLGTAFSYLDRSATSLLLEIRRRDTYQFCVAAQDPLLLLEEYKLTSAFAAGSSLASVDPDEDEPDPDSLAQSPVSTDPDEDEPDPDSLAFGGGASAAVGPRDRGLRELLDAMCRSGEVDDHGDTFACATAVDPGRAVAGEVRNDWGDDADVFAFLLTELETVEIATTGKTDTFGALYDFSGHRLGTDDDGGGRGNFRIARTLGPGWYFVRVAGSRRSEGGYRLRVNYTARLGR